jgi:hypothetical protein
VVAYGTALNAVGLQRRGGGRGWQVGRQVLQQLLDVLPQRRHHFASPDQALFRCEWRRSGWVLPGGVLLTVLLIMCTVTGFAGGDPEMTARAAAWIVGLPFVLAAVVGKGFAKPDFWSLEPSLAPFWATRPVTSGQFLAAKLKTAALSTVVAWALLLAVALPWLGLACDLRDLRAAWHLFTTLYSALARWTIVGLLVVGALIVTWGLMIGSLWSGLYGRPRFFAGTVGLSSVCFLFLVGWLFWMVDDKSGVIVPLLPWLPWVLAAAFVLKGWTALWAWRCAYQSALVSWAFVYTCFGIWIVATGCLVILACCLSPRIEWLCQLLVLTALLLCPLARIGLAALSLAQNRHR